MVGCRSCGFVLYAFSRALVWALFCSRSGFARLGGFSGWRTMFWAFVSSRKAGEQPWECACWLFISPLLVRLACLRVSGVDSFSTQISGGSTIVKGALTHPCPALPWKNPPWWWFGAPQWQKHWASIRLPLNLALAGVQVPRSQCCI